jgi:hypothetical protein
MEWVEKLMRGVSRQAYAATLPPHLYYCLLDELPLHLIPQPALKAFRLHAGDEDLRLNPECELCPAGQWPGEAGSEFKKSSSEFKKCGFVRQGSVALVRDHATHAQLPFWLGSELEAVVRGLRPNEPVPSNLREDLRIALFGAGILTTAEYTVLRRREWELAVEKSATSFREKGYALLAEWIHPFHVAALRRYYRYLIRTGAIRLGDGQSPRRYVAYNEPVARFFHRLITPTLSAVVGQAIKPSYVYMASYLSGAELKKHTDRTQCEFSITLCLDFSPEPALETTWPIRLDTPSGSVAVYQALGHGLAYRGTRLPHYRDALGVGKTSTSIFFHYVAEDFAGSLE